MTIQVFKVSREFKVGVLVVVGIAILVVGLNYLKGIDLFKQQRVYYARYANVDGLVEANPVTINGYKVGLVKSIKLLPGRSGEILVTLVVYNKELEIPKDTKARIYSSDLLGSKGVELGLGELTEIAESGDTLTSEVEEGIKDAVNQQILPLKKKAESLISSIDTAVQVVQAIFNEDARKNLSNSFESISRALKTFEKTSLELDQLIKGEREKLSMIFTNIEMITSNFRKNNQRLNNIMQNMSVISDSLARSNITSTINNADLALHDFSEVMDKINRGEGSIGMLINDDSLYNNVSSASRQLDLLLEDVRIHPSRYLHFSVFGKKEKKLKLTRKEIQQLQEILRPE